MEHDFFKSNRICTLLGIKYPVIQAGMVWCSGWELASAVSNAGGLGVIGSGSMGTEILKEHIQKTKSATNKPFAVNIPLIYGKTDAIIDTILSEEVKIVITSAGNPATWTQILKNSGLTVMHVVSSAKFAKKAEEAGVDAIVAEGFEAGGHNGREETTSFVLIPLVNRAVHIPVIAAGGICTGAGMLAAIVLGAEGVQVGSRFAVSAESSAHIHFKDLITKIKEGDTRLTLKQLAPVRLIKNDFYKRVEEAEKRCASVDEMKQLLGKGRSRKGIFEGDLAEGELEIGQVSALISEIQPAGVILNEIIEEYLGKLDKLTLNHDKKND